MSHPHLCAGGFFCPIQALNTNPSCHHSQSIATLTHSSNNK
ncbi:hypothetical protein [Rubritalea tangerina]